MSDSLEIVTLVATFKEVAGDGCSEPKEAGGGDGAGRIMDVAKVECARGREVAWICCR